MSVYRFQAPAIEGKDITLAAKTAPAAVAREQL
jgi:hypothetical protein